MLNGVTHLLMMKADVLNKFEELLVCTHYKLEDGSIVDQIPYDIVRTNVTPVYKKFKGWNQDLSDVKTFEAMPQELVDYIAFVEQQLNVPISLISIGPDRTQTIVRDSEAVIL
jgi:adenylosuccinate synthase